MEQLSFQADKRSPTELKSQNNQHAKTLSNNKANQLMPDDMPIHDWYRFVLSFPPHLVREYLENFNVRQSDLVLDPFSGTGTTLVECKKNGIPSVGIEAHPMPYFASKVKIDWSIGPSGLLRYANKIAKEAFDTLQEEGIEDVPSLTGNHRKISNLRVLPPDEHQLLIKNSISPIPLHKTLVLRDAIDRYSDSRYYDHAKLALAKSLVTSIGNLHFGPEVGVGKKKVDAPVVTAWLKQVKSIASDLKKNGRGEKTASYVHLADSRDVDNLLEENSINCVFTSPPYPNEKDYTRTTRLESVILGFIDGKLALREVKKTLLRSNTRNIYKDDDDDQWIIQFPEILDIAEKIESRRVELGKTSGFERMYHRVTKQYFGGMFRHFRDLRKSLVPGALLGYVVGDQASYLRIMIRTGHLLSQIAESLGYETASRDLFRTRLATATREELREEVLVLRWPG